MEKTNNALENYQLDIDELNKFILHSTRPNVKRNLEEFKKNLSFMYEDEKKKINTDKKEESAADVKSETSKITSTPKIDLIPITKYAFENSDKFVK